MPPLPRLPRSPRDKSDSPWQFLHKSMAESLVLQHFDKLEIRDRNKLKLKLEIRSKLQQKCRKEISKFGRWCYQTCGETLLQKSPNWKLYFSPYCQKFGRRWIKALQEFISKYNSLEFSSLWRLKSMKSAFASLDSVWKVIRVWNLHCENFTLVKNLIFCKD